jgi:hypothetical protein
VSSTRPIVARIVRQGTGRSSATFRAYVVPERSLRLRCRAVMGQPITVVEKPSGRPGVVRFEANRSLTGMGHERYRSAADALADRPVDELARRLFENGGIDAVHIYSNVITVDLAKGATSNGLLDIIRDLFIYYRPGVKPPEFETEEPPAETNEAEAAAAPQ